LGLGSSSAAAAPRRPRRAGAGALLRPRAPRAGGSSSAACHRRSRPSGLSAAHKRGCQQRKCHLVQSGRVLRRLRCSGRCAAALRGSEEPTGSLGGGGAGRCLLQHTRGTAGAHSSHDVSSTQRLVNAPTFARWSLRPCCRSRMQTTRAYDGLKRAGAGWGAPCRAGRAPPAGWRARAPPRAPARAGAACPGRRTGPSWAPSSPPPARSRNPLTC